MWTLLAPPTLALPALPLRRESGEGNGAVSVRVLPHGIAPVPVLESAEVEVRVIASSLESDVTATVTWSDLAALAHPPPLRKYSDQHSRSRDFYRERSRDRRDSREYRTRDSQKRSLYRLRSRERAYRSRTPSERGGLAGRCGKSGTLLLGKKKKRSEVGAVRHMIQNVMSSFQKSLEAFGDNASNSSSAGASSRGTPSPRGERPAKSVSSARQGGASSSRFVLS